MTASEPRFQLTPMGDRAFLARFESGRKAIAWADAVRSERWPGVLDVVAAHRSAAVFADPDEADLEAMETWLRSIPVLDRAVEAGRLVRVPVLYDGEDLPEIARRLGRTEADIVALHAGTEYTITAIGFLPGFPYAGDLPPALSGLPRREPPRVRVPAGSVAIAGRQTCIYPRESPGGWHLLGVTPLRIVDLEDEFFPLRTGDRLRFEPIDAERFGEMRGRRIETETEDGSEPRGSAGT